MTVLPISPVASATWDELETVWSCSTWESWAIWDMNVDELVGCRGFWYLSSSTRRVRKVVGSSRLDVALESVVWTGAVTGAEPCVGETEVVMGAPGVARWVRGAFGRSGRRSRS